MNDVKSFVKVSEIDRRKEVFDLMATVSIVLQQIAHPCLHDEPSCRPAPTEICDQLEVHIKKLEMESETEAKQCKGDKLTLLRSLQYVKAQLEKNKQVIKSSTKKKL